MSYSIYLNPDNLLGLSSYDFGDINMIYSGAGVSGDQCIYWNNYKSTPINFHTLYDSLTSSGYSVPSLPMNFTNLEKAYSGEWPSYEDCFKKEYHWICGSFDEHVGLVASIPEANKITLSQFYYGGTQETYVQDGYIGTIQVFSSTHGTVDNVVYLCDDYYVKGEVQENTSAVLHGVYDIVIDYDPVNGQIHDYRENASSVKIHGGDSVWESPTTRIVPYMLGSYRTGDHGWKEYIINGGYQKKPDAYGKTGGDTKPDGGNGEVRQSEEVDHPTAPPEMLSNSGIIKFYTPTSTEMQNFVNYLYSQPDAFYTNLKKMWANPFESIITFGIVPFAIEGGESEVVKFCGLSTNTSMKKCNQFVTKNFGDLVIPHEDNSALDYSNYTKVKCYLPMIGFVDMNCDDVMGATLNLQYIIDLLTGDCVATIKVTKKWSDYIIDYNSVLYQYKGNVLSQAPISGNNYAGLYTSLLNIGTNILMPTPHSVSGIASEIMGQKVSVQHGSSVGGNSGHLGMYRPYVIVECPIPSTTNEMYKYQAYPMNEAVQLEFYKNKGYTIVKQGTLRIYDINCTKEEQEEIIKLFETGVIL